MALFNFIRKYCVMPRVTLIFEIEIELSLSINKAVIWLAARAAYFRAFSNICSSNAILLRNSLQNHLLTNMMVGKIFKLFTFHPLPCTCGSMLKFI